MLNRDIDRSMLKVVRTEFKADALPPEARRVVPTPPSLPPSARRARVFPSFVPC